MPKAAAERPESTFADGLYDSIHAKENKMLNEALMIPMKCRDEPNESLFVLLYFYCPAFRDFGRSPGPLPDQRSECMQISKF